MGAAASSGLVLPGVAGAGPANSNPTDLMTAADGPTTAAISGLAAFIVPGQDEYSTSQGTPRTEPGGVAARTPELIITMFNTLLRNPSGSGFLPLSDLIAQMLNLVAQGVNPGSVTGPFASPFANLAAPEKAVVFMLLENPPPWLLEAILSQVPEQLRPAFPGLLPYLVAGLLAYPSLVTYSEWSTFDPQTGSLTGRPVGWAISGFDPGVLDGWNDFRGYYQNRQEVHD
jgi:hypothetical protein